jgi:chorismate dehydratase
MAVRVGAVSYLNARPLAHYLSRWPDRFAVRYDEPSRCATLLHEGAIDVGLIPSIEYSSGEYRIVPGIGVISDGPVASVALFTKVPVARVRSIALDTSSRTSTALMRVLCARHFRIAPAFMPHEPDLETMLRRCDAALVIGDRALFADARAIDVEKVDLGSEWLTMTGLPFVYAFWAGAPDALSERDVACLQEARDIGAREVDQVVASFFPEEPRKRATGARYLRENIRFELDERARQGFELFATLAADVGAALPPRPMTFYEGPADRQLY